LIRLLTAGESHGPRLVVIVDGLPAGLRLRPADINIDLQRRQGGYGRGGRQQIERDQVEIVGGVRLGRSLGTPVADAKIGLVSGFGMINYDRGLCSGAAILAAS